ncbi:MAG TPA: GNAT family protein [Alphaproteobacteria bacterium]|nr:GNAT family protein [Alphaproteobacteria bacterium]
MLISSKDISLREWISSDMPALEILANDPEISYNVGPIFPYNRIEKRFDYDIAAKYMQTTSDQKNLAITFRGELVGGAGLVKDKENPLQAKGHTWLSKSFRGKGIGSECMKLATIVAFYELDYEQIERRAYDWNTASIKAVNKTGYEFLGIKESTWDQIKIKEHVYYMDIKRFLEPDIYAIYKSIIETNIPLSKISKIERKIKKF